MTGKGIRFVIGCRWPRVEGMSDTSRRRGPLTPSTGLMDSKAIGTSVTLTLAVNWQKVQGSGVGSGFRVQGSEVGFSARDLETWDFVQGARVGNNKRRDR